jgi:hypothetical protein
VDQALNDRDRFLRQNADAVGAQLFKRNGCVHDGIREGPAALTGVYSEMPASATAGARRRIDRIFARVDVEVSGLEAERRRRLRHSFTPLLHNTTR